MGSTGEEANGREKESNESYLFGVEARVRESEMHGR